MSKKALRIALIVLLVAIAISSIIILIPKKEIDNGKMNIVVTTFSSYDFVKHIVGDKANVIYLLGPGVDSHSYEPSGKDIKTIKNADMFIYIGGEMEKWTDEILQREELKSNAKVIRVSECVDTIEEQEIDGAEEEEEEEIEGAFDEHIWTSPANAIKMMEYLNKQICELDSQNKDFYIKNTQEYVAQIKDVQAKIREITDKKVRDRLVFGDKMPMQYFLNEYGLKASAAFSGCSTETEPGQQTFLYLISKVKDEKIPVVLYIELNNGRVAQSIAKAAGAEAMQIQTLHNVSKTDFDNGESYVSLMNRNLEVLKKALQ